MITIRYRLFKSILMVCILQFMIGCGDDSVDELTDAAAGNPVDNLAVAAATGNVEKVKQILTENPELIDQRDSENETALFRAIDKGHIDMKNF